jgi:hypothetical protein
MILRRLIGCLPVAAVAVCVLTACKGSASKDDAGGQGAPQTAAPASGELLDKRCEQLAKACGAKDKHQAKILEECKAAAKDQAEKGCGEKVAAAYDCYEKEICEAINKVWAMDDFRVLGDRNKKCIAERTASDACIGNAK